MSLRPPDPRVFGRLPPAAALMVVAVLAWILMLSASGAAHGILERSRPAANASLDVPPSEVVLSFNEPVDPAFSAATILGRDGKRVSQRMAISKDRTQITVSPTTLPQGVYTVKWRALWPLDGHTTSGFFVFAVGQAVPADVAAEGTATAGPFRVALRWIALAAALLLAGSRFFQASVLRAGLRLLPREEAEPMALVVMGRLRRLTVIAGVALLLAVGWEFLLQAGALLDTSVLQVFTGGMFWPLLGGTKPGWSVLIRMSMALVMVLPLSPRARMIQAGAFIWILLFGGVSATAGGPAALWGAGIHALPVVLAAQVYALVVVMAALVVPALRDVRVPQMQWVSDFAAPVLLAGVTVSSHASGSSTLAAFADWIHLLAAAAWIGGLASLLLVLRAFSGERRVRLARLIVPRFSKLAGISLGVLVVTGAYSTVLYLPSVRAFLDTRYGRTLLLKLVLVVPLATLGALNHFVLRPRIASAGDADRSPVRRLVRSVTGEVGLATVILLVVAVLTITPPAAQTSLPEARQPLRLAGLAADVKVSLTLAPLRPGLTGYEVIPTDREDTRVRGARVMLRLTKLDEDLVPASLVLAEQEDGRYTAEGGELALSGFWSVQAVVRRRGRLDVSTSFPFRAGDAGAPSSDSRATRLLRETEEAMGRFSTWRQVEQITDGSGGMVTTRYAFIKPDRVRYRSDGGGEAIVIGSAGYFRSGPGAWRRDALPQPVNVESAVAPYSRGAEAVRLGREEPCGEETCRIVLWQAPGGTSEFAGWIGTKSARLYRLMMIAPSHLMTLEPTDLNTPVDIRPPQ